MWVQEVFWMTIRMCDASVTCTVLYNGVFHPDFLTASPGTVHAFDDSTKEVVECTCSVLP